MVIAENAHSKSCFSRKSGRGGRSLLIGLLRCGRCGRMLHVAYKVARTASADTIAEAPSSIMVPIRAFLLED